MHEPTAGAPARDRITVSGITATGHHGVFDHERRDGQTFVADVTLHVDTRPAAAEDRLDLTVHYGVLSEQVAGVLSGEPADLVETVAERIAAVALTHPGVHAVDVVVHKPQAPVTVPFGDVTVQIHRDREHAPAVGAPPVVVDAVPGLVPDEVPSPEAGVLAEQWTDHAHQLEQPAEHDRLRAPEPVEATALFVPDWAEAEEAHGGRHAGPDVAPVVGSGAALPGAALPGAALPAAALPSALA
ncbi:dihydroneopterin aldolase, partial [Actinotalea ferrariae]|uniref:dihydroneopterin aldolase n=1 Tax=Actinotalea ferrariae TaxID=1386098 RepID=UPI0027E194F2